MNEHSKNPSQKNFSTQAIHAGQDPEKWDSRCVVPPLVLSTTFKQFAPADCIYYYARCGNPTRNMLEECLAKLENAQHALCFSSGLGATTTVSYLLQSGDHIMMCDDIYAGTSCFFRTCASRMGIQSSFVDMLDLDNIKKSLQENTKMVWIESPSNPTLKIVDIKAICETVRVTHPNIIIVVDNTFCSSFFQNPLEFGVDIVLHSLTKYMNGHSDVIMGATMTNNEDYYKRLQFLQSACGVVPSPFDCYLVNRGVKTLSVRMKQHMESGLKIAKWLEANPRIEKVLYPPLPSHPQHEIYKRQMKGFGGMISMYIKGGLNEATIFLKNLKLITLAVSLGGFETIIEIPALMSHESVPKEQRDALGISDNLFRMSVGLENPDDLIADLDQALHTAIPTL